MDIRGFDLVPAFIDGARTTYPGVRFDLGSIDAIDENDGAVGGILSWFSTIHHEPEHIAVPLSEFARVLRPAGTLLIGYFDGEQIEPSTTRSRAPTAGRHRSCSHGSIRPASTSSKPTGAPSAAAARSAPSSVNAGARATSTTANRADDTVDGCRERGSPRQPPRPSRMSSHTEASDSSKDSSAEPSSHRSIASSKHVTAIAASVRACRASMPR